MADVTASPSPVHDPVHWMFEDRKTGKIVLWQWPNVPLWIWIASRVVSRFLDGGVGTAVGVIGTVALAVWAVLEVGWGVNPFRRIVGGIVLAMLIVGVVIAAT